MNYRILAVEDSPTQADALCMLLESNGYDVTLARSGEAALERLAEAGFDLVISDIMMPGITGYELCRRIKNESRLRDTPVLLLTTLTDPMDIVRGLEAGADNYLTKPYDAEQLLARVRRVLDNSRLRPNVRTSMGVNIEFLGTTFTINSDREQILDLLLSSVEDIVRANHELEERQAQLTDAHRQLEAYAHDKTVEAELSTERYRVLMRDASDAIFLLDDDGTIIEANHQAADLLGRPVEDLLWQPISSFVSQSETESFAEWLHSLEPGQALPPADRTMITTDGAERRVEFSASASHVQDDMFILAIARDVTAQREYTAKLRSSQRQLAEAQQIAHLGSWEWHLATNTLSSSDEVAGIHGVAPDDFGTGWYDVFLAAVHRDDRARVEAQLDALLAGVNSLDVEYRFFRPTGEVRVVHVRGELVHRDGSPSRVIGTIQDITERREAERRLRESEALFRTLIDAAPVGIIEFDAQALIRVWNPAAERIFGFSAAQVIGNALPYPRPEDQQQFRENWDRIVAGEPFSNVELRRTRTDGATIDLSVSAAPMFTDGVLSGVIGIVADITERRRSEEALLRSEEQLRQAQRMEAIGRLTGGIAHDFNNMLTAIMGSTELLLLDAPADGTLREDLQEIDAVARRAAALTKQLLAFSRNQVLQPDLVDVNEIVRRLDHMLRRLIGEDIVLTTDLDADLPRVLADPGQLEQVLMNLVVNARDAMPDGGTIRIETGSETASALCVEGAGGRCVAVRVADTGSGMTREVRERIFEPFFTTKGPGKGTGLGLSTVYGIVAQSGGGVEVDTEPGRGTTVMVLLPEAAADAPAPARAAARTPGTPPDEAMGGTETVLLVEDEHAVRRLAARVLRKHGYTVIEASDAAEALEVLGPEGPAIDLLVSDLVMPGMSGRELARRLSTVAPTVRILLMSGYSAEDVADREGAPVEFHMLEKPFMPRDLLRVVREILAG